MLRYSQLNDAWDSDVGPSAPRASLTSPSSSPHGCCSSPLFGGPGGCCASAAASTLGLDEVSSSPPARYRPVRTDGAPSPLSSPTIPSPISPVDDVGPYRTRLHPSPEGNRTYSASVSAQTLAPNAPSTYPIRTSSPTVPAYAAAPRSATLPEQVHGTHPAVLTASSRDPSCAPPWLVYALMQDLRDRDRRLEKERDERYRLQRDYDRQRQAYQALQKATSGVPNSSAPTRGNKNNWSWIVVLVTLLVLAAAFALWMILRLHRQVQDLSRALPSSAVMCGGPAAWPPHSLVQPSTPMWLPLAAQSPVSGVPVENAVSARASVASAFSSPSADSTYLLLPSVTMPTGSGSAQ